MAFVKVQQSENRLLLGTVAFSAWSIEQVFEPVGMQLHVNSAGSN